MSNGTKLAKTAGRILGKLAAKATNAILNVLFFGVIALLVCTSLGVVAKFVCRCVVFGWNLISWNVL